VQFFPGFVPRIKLAHSSVPLLERTCTEAAGFDQAKQYGIKTMPTIVVDGQIAFEGKITEAQADILNR
jgi:hypothetical protein